MMHSTVLGKNSGRLKELLRLARRRHREEEDKFIVEGPRLIAEALSAAWPLEAIYLVPEFRESGKGKEILAAAREKGLTVYEIAPGALTRVTAVEEPQGVFAVARVGKTDFRDLIRVSYPLVVVIDGIRDPGNLGTIIRTAQAAGASGALLLTGSADLYNSKTIRATAGALFRLPVRQDVGREEALDFIGDTDLKLVVSDPRGGVPLYKADLTGPVALVVGGEGEGVSPPVREAASLRVSIPMPGGSESLNAAVAAALLLYEAVRQRHGFA
ncbi:MAG: RNA methyltransferase [Bacillota bacterium]